MMPGTVKGESHVNLNNSCNYCCCFGWKRRDKTKKKVAAQAEKISKQESPRRAEHKVTQIHLDITQTDDAVMVMDYKVGPDKE